LTGTNKEFIDSKIPHLAKLMVSSLEEIIKYSDILVVAYKDDQFVDILESVEDKLIVDLVRLPEQISSKLNYHGINW